MVYPVRTTADAGASADFSWNDAPHPVVIADVRGTLVLVNKAAASLLPTAGIGLILADVAPAWLSQGHASLCGTGQDSPEAEMVSGEIGDRCFEAHPAVRDDRCVMWWLMDVTEERRVRESLRLERERTEFLSRSSNLLLSSLNLDRCMAVTAQMAAEYLADAALVIAPPQGDRLPVTACLRGGVSSLSHRVADPREVPGLGEALQGFPPVPSRWLDPATASEWLVPEGFGQVGSIAITPLPGHGVPAGALVLLRRSQTAAFTEREEVFARLFAARAGAAMSAARLYGDQSAITDVLMRELLPPALRSVDGVDYAGGYRPSQDHERIGGDFYDVHPATTEGKPSLTVLGDVCGKGLEAAVMTGKIRNTLQALLPMADDHHQMLSLLNTSLLTSHHARFATLVLASAVRENHQVRLRLTSAGHLAPLIVRADGQVEEANTSGTLVGALPEAPSRSAEVILAPGETCVLYTDGITEARGGPLGEVMFGESRLRHALSECAELPAESVVERIQMLASEWVGTGSHDDMAVVAIAAPRTRHLSAVNGHTRGRYTA